MTPLVLGGDRESDDDNTGRRDGEVNNMANKEFVRVYYRWIYGLRLVLQGTIAGLIAAVLLLPGLCSAASFNCDRATTPVEKRICEDKALSQLDEDLTSTYRKVLRWVPDPAVLRKEQARWLRDVRDRCLDNGCLEKAYRDRLAALEKREPLATADESDPCFLFRCEKSRNRLTIINANRIDSETLKTTRRLPGDMTVHSYELTKIVEVEDEAYIEQARKAYYRCKLGTADYRVSVEPHIFGSRISGMCGAYPPSISVTIFRNGQRLASDIALQRDCMDDEHIIDAIHIDEAAQSITLFSGLSVFERHIEKEFPFNELPDDWYAALFEKWPSGNPLVDLRHGVKAHDLALITQALDKGADVNFHTPEEGSVLCEVFDRRIHAESESKETLADFDRDTDRILAMLLARGALPTITTENGAGVIDCAAISGAPIRTIRMLLDAGWPQDYPYRLYAGALIGNPELVQEALHHGADPNTTPRGARPLVLALTQARAHASEGRNEQLKQAIAAIELLLKQGAHVDEGKPREGGGDMVQTYAHSGGLPAMRPVFELLVRYASPAARSNSLHWLKIMAKSPRSSQETLLPWLLEQLEKASPEQPEKN